MKRLSTAKPRQSHCDRINVVIIRLFRLNKPISQKPAALTKTRQKYKKNIKRCEILKFFFIFFFFQEFLIGCDWFLGRC